MHEIDADGHVGNQFSNGDPVAPTRPTAVDADWLNAVQGELKNAITDHTALAKGTNTQLANALALMLGDPGGRLSITGAGTPGPVQDTSGDFLHYQPFRHNRARLWNGSRWELKVIPAAGTLFIDVAGGAAADTNYDVFLWMDGTTMKLCRGPAWASATSRGTGAGTTELELKDGVWVNKVAISGGPAAQRGLYLGTVRTDGSGLVNDTTAKRHVFNAHNRVERAMANAAEGTDAWTYASTTIRQANGNTANRVEFVIGLDEDAVIANVIAHAGVTGAGTGRAKCGIGLDSTSARAAGSLWTGLILNTGNGAHLVNGQISASYRGRPGIGSHYLAWLEQSDGSADYYGDNGGNVQSGISGVIRA